MIDFLKECWVCFALLPVAWYFQLVIHELSHAFVAKFLLGYEITRVRLYPIRWGDFARCEWRNNTKKRKTTSRIFAKSFLYTAPIWSGLIVYFIFMAVSLKFDVLWPMAFMVMGIGEVFMYLYGSLFGSENCDAKKAARQ